MEQIHSWTSNSFKGSKGYSGWTSQAAQHIVDLDFECGNQERFEARFRQRSVGAVGATLIDVGQLRAIRHAARHQHNPVRYDLKYVRAGQMTVEQAGRRIVALRGDFVLLDNNRDFVLEAPEDLRCLCLTLPERWLQARIAAPQNVLAQPPDRQSPWAAGLRIMLDALFQEGSVYDYASDSLVADQIGGFIELLWGTSSQPSGDWRTKRVMEMRRIVAANLHNPDFSPGILAEAMRLSSRSIHTAFAAAGTTFGRELAAARISRAVQMLNQPRYAHAKISEIAFTCGYNDTTHFARQFRAQRGVSPSEYRARL